MKTDHFEYLEMETPFGLWHLVALNDEIVAFGANLPLERWMAAPNPENSVLLAAALELKEYFAGQRRNFTFKIGFPWGTEFQRRAWKMLLKIPYGQTWTYGKQAEQMKISKGFRAVGSANGKNPLCVIVPCHRVIAADGRSGGYSGGLHVKKSLLALESGAP